jgi:hypothetical protein
MKILIWQDYSDRSNYTGVWSETRKRLIVGLEAIW